MPDIIPPTSILIAPKPDSHHSPNSKLLSPLQPSTNNNIHPVEKTLVDVTTGKVNPTKCLPKLNPPKAMAMTITQSVSLPDATAPLHHITHHHSPPKLDPHPTPALTLTPLSSSASSTLPTGTEITVPSHNNSSTPSLAPLSASTSNLSSEKLKIESPGDTSSHHKKKPATRRISLEPLPLSAPPPQLAEYLPTEHNGTVTLLYELYHETFEITNGTITEAAINDTYGLSEVMPNCRLRISTWSPTEIREQAIIAVADNNSSHSASTAVIYLPEMPEGTYCNLQNDHSYYVYVNEDKEQLEKEQAERDRINQQKLADNKHEHKIERDDGRGFDSCTCIYGTPCVDEYGCRDWSKRFDVASINGWAGFPTSNAT